MWSEAILPHSIQCCWWNAGHACQSRLTRFSSALISNPHWPLSSILTPALTSPLHPSLPPALTNPQHPSPTSTFIVHLHHLHSSFITSPALATCLLHSVMSPASFTASIRKTFYVVIIIFTMCYAQTLKATLFFLDAPLLLQHQSTKWRNTDQFFSFFFPWKVNHNKFYLHKTQQSEWSILMSHFFLPACGEG